MGGEKARNIFKRLYGRKLFKMIGELALKDVASAPAKKRLLQMDDERKQQWEGRIAECLEVDSDYVIVNKLQIGNPNYGSRSYDLNPEAVRIFEEKQGHLRNLGSYATELIPAHSPSADEALETIQVYAPMEGWSDLPMEQRQQKRSELETEVREVLLHP